MAKVADAMDRRNILHLKIPNTEAPAPALRTSGKRAVHHRTPSRPHNLPQHANSSSLLRESNAHVIAALLRRRHSRIIQRHPDKNNVADIGLPLRQPREQRVIRVHEARVAIRREYPDIDEAERIQTPNPHPNLRSFLPTLELL